MTTTKSLEWRNTPFVPAEVSLFAGGQFSQRSTNNSSVSKVYADVNNDANPEQWDYERFEPQWGSQERFDVVRKLGRGKYSEVFAGVDTETEKSVVVKILKPVKRKKILREVKILEALKGGDYVPYLIEAVRDPVSKTCSLVTEYLEGHDFKSLYPTLKNEDIQLYMYQLLTALDYAHARGIMHRDVKPHNIMIDHKNKRLRLIDWGLAEFYRTGIEYNVRVASRYYKGPELLTNMKDYDYSLDMWSFGCTFAGIVFRVHPLFQGKDNNDQLVKIVNVLGHDALDKYLAKYRLTLDSTLQSMVKPASGRIAPRPWSSFVNESNAQVATPEAIDLLSRVLTFDHQDRLTAREAMDHPYFNNVRHLVPDQPKPERVDPNDMSAQALLRALTNFKITDIPPALRGSEEVKMMAAAAAAAQKKSS